MTNLFKRFFTHKSKFLLIIISLLGLAFSYSCSCRDNPVAPPPETPGGKQYTPSATLSRSLMVVKSDASDTSYPISVTVENADVDFDSSTISGGSLTKEDFDFANGVLKVKKEKLASVGEAKETYSLTLKFKPSSLFGANDTLSTDTDTEKTFELVKAQKKTLSDLQKIFTNDIQVFSEQDVTINCFNATVSGSGFLVPTKGTELDGDYVTKKIGKEVFGSDKLLPYLKKGISGSAKDYLKDVKYIENKPNGDNQIFYYNLVFDDAYEIDNPKISIEIENKQHPTGNNLPIEWTE